ncbi:MAG: hypothetical protein IJ710_08910 [Prevotella sp.]|nr:hypothetical protein [Prevotella sp.]
MKSNDVKQHILRHYAAAVGLIGAVSCFVFYQFWYPYHFFYKEQNQLFLWTGDYLSTYFSKPAWLACLAGDFLTQFYYYLYAGAAILSVVLLFTGWVLYVALRRAGVGRHWAFAIAAVVFALEAVCHLRYDFRLSSTLALTGSALVFIAIRPLLGRRLWLSGAVLFAASIATYWLFGYGLWVLQALALITVSTQWPRHKSPLQYIVYAMPCWVGVLIMAFGPRLYLLETGKLMTYPGIGRLTAPNFALEYELGIDSEYALGNLNRVIKRVEANPQPTFNTLFYYNLVQAQRGLLPDVLLKYQPNNLGTFHQIGPQTPMMTIKHMNELYWVLGDMTFTERAALMASVFSPGNRNVRMMKRLAECNLVSGDSAAARKYLGLLRHTLVYRQWAANAPTTVAYAEKRRSLPQRDTITTSDNAHFLMMQLLDANPQNTIALDYILCSTLLLKDIENFKRDYDRYCTDTNQPRPKALYQQALCIWLAGTNASTEEWQRYIQSPETVRQFQQYSQQRGNPAFRDTYWYYFDRGIKPEIK